ncbi:TPA: hypothetical protein DEF17_05925 [bacterium]|nr:MAG: hypothetical protein AUJ18_09865 [Candidatus Hydrogenedentes bacterium CG1_02_42_14]HBW47454.1 hypothetical protein [bacterium]
MTKNIEILLLLALPASGKSEVRRYMDFTDAKTRQSDFGIGETVQLDDYPYVHSMRRIDDELISIGANRIFFQASDKPFRDTKHWLTLIELINEDYSDLIEHKKVSSNEPGKWLLQRIEAASKRAGATLLSSVLNSDLEKELGRRLDKESSKLIEEKNANLQTDLNGKTIVIEFARGGPDGAEMPLSEPLGYRSSLKRLSDSVLQKASILYIWVTPEESRRKNDARTDPNDPGSILHHGVPLEVMLKDYGCDDIDWLITNSKRRGTVEIEKDGKSFFLPTARFDNRVDKTSFLRDDPSTWKKENVLAVHEELKRALSGKKD